MPLPFLCAAMLEDVYMSAWDRPAFCGRDAGEENLAHRPGKMQGFEEGLGSLPPRGCAFGLNRRP
jgi:hypothetical protein